MEEYINKYPKEERNIFTLMYTFGIDKADEICKEALSLNKRIKLISDSDLDRLDYLEYKFV